MTPNWGRWVRGTVACAAALYVLAWVVHGVLLWQRVEAVRAALGPFWSDDGMFLAGTVLGPPTIRVRQPALQAEVGGEAVAWRAQAATMEADWSGGIAIRFGGQAILTPDGPVFLSTDAWDSAAGGFRTPSLTVGLGPDAMQLMGVQVSAGPGSLRVTADALVSGRLALQPSPERLVVEADLPAMDAGWHERAKAWLAQGAPASLRGMEATWAGAKLTGAGTLSWHGTAPTFEGTVTIEGYAGALDRLSAAGSLTPAAARAARAVLDAYAGAQPPAPLPMAWRDGVLAVGGLPVWRAVSQAGN